MRWLLGFMGAVVLACPSNARAAEVSVAAAAHLAGAVQPLSEQFARRTGHRLQISFGSSGKLTSQIMQSAPFDVFLSADQEHPRKLVASRHAVAGSELTYAFGKLVLWVPQPQGQPPSAELLRQGRFQHIAIANPRLAPYGAAAREVLHKLNLWDSIQPKLVFGENIAQTHQFVATGNAHLGFVAASQLHAFAPDAKPLPNTHWLIPQTLYSPLKHDAVLLAHGKNSSAAKEFLNFLKSEDAKKILRAQGYTHE